MQIIVVSTIEQGVERAKEVLYEKVDRKTVLFLSGGKTPAPLYLQLAKEEILTPAAVGMVDERYGMPLHENSNQRLFKDTRLLSFFEKKKIPFHPILGSVHPRGGRSQHLGGDGENLRKETAAAYDTKVRDLFFHFPRSVAVMGMGADGHISSIIPNRKNFVDPMFAESEHHIFVGEFNDTKSTYGERIGMTFAGLALVDFFVVLVFGKDKKKALQAMLTPGSLTEIPARFFTQQVSSNTVIITDQGI